MALMLEEEDPMDQVLALAGQPTLPVAPEVDRFAPAMPQVPLAEPLPVTKDAYPSDRGTGASKAIEQGHVDPGLAFMAAFSQNPMLAKMVDEQRNRPFRDAESQRAQEKWQLERDIMSPLKAEGMRGKNAMQGSAMEAADPKSAYSQAMRQGVANGLMQQAARMKATNPQIAQMMSEAATSIGNNDRLSAKQAMDVAKQFSGVGDKVVSDAHKQAMLGESQRFHDAQIQHMGEQDKQGWARIEAMRQRALQPRVGARERAAQIKNQEKLDDEIEKAEWARNMLLRVAELKKNVNTGPLAGRAQNLLQEVDLSSPEFNAMKQTLQMVSNRIIKELSGSAVTGNEWARMQDELANIMNDDDNFATKLANMVELTESIKQRAINRYARNDQGAPTDTTNTAKRTTAQKPVTMPGETPPPDATPQAKMKAPPGKAPGAMVRQKSTGKVFRVTQDGHLEEVR